jgi:predicted DNA-binding transcriptional regulator YafY
MRSARLTKQRFERRDGFDPTRLRDARTVTVLYTEDVAPWARERGARPLADGTALTELPVGSVEWLVAEIFSYRGEAIVLEPDDLRAGIARRAAELSRELGVERLRVKS